MRKGRGCVPSAVTTTTGRDGDQGVFRALPRGRNLASQEGTWGAKRPKDFVGRNVSQPGAGGMDHSEGVIQAPASTTVPQELLEEMLWFFRVEDASPWNYSIFALVGVVGVISFVLLGRSIQANRNQKLLGKNKPELQDLAEAETRDDNNLNILRETLLSEKHNLAQVAIELKEADAPLALLPDPQESET
ncbi:organic solute transporter subunit beta isoform X1 [Halichoerus grypus]|uniref:organic solute transporter subunit beta isoform X2 n=1 Tax=Halichoerus grypus TaxID=9711 RepID=UPI00165A054F|nr:organic solute transporter subunit beta isoform X2 [Halichoerus grypus]